jgi:HAD superfamily hydrolase (TIGR01509 family)
MPRTLHGKLYNPNMAPDSSHRRLLLLAMGLACAGSLAMAPSLAGAKPRLVLDIRNVIFDLGGVIVDLEHAAFKKKMGALVGDLDAPAFRRIVERFEMGKLSISQFRDVLRRLRPKNARLTDRAIDAAWNVQIGKVDCRKLQLVKQLRAMGVKTYVLSTSNRAHARVVVQRFRRCFPKVRGDIFAHLFHKTYFTFDVGLLKPDPKLFRHVIKDARLKPGQTLFIDDGRKNVLAAQQVGLHALVIPDSSFVTWLPGLVKQ